MPGVRGRTAALPNVAGALIALAALALFALDAPLIGWAMLLAGVGVGFASGRSVGLDLVPVATGIGILTLLPAEPELGVEGMGRFSVVLAAALLVPWLIARFATRTGGVAFEFRDGRRWGRAQWAFLAAVPFLGYLVLPAYFIGGEGHANWPAVNDGGAVAMLAVGILGLGLWEELFFVSVVYGALRRHLAAWPAIVLRAAVVVPLLWDWGFTGPGIAIIAAFSLAQGWIYERTRSLSYVIAVHLTFDLVMIAVLVWAKHPTWPDIFLTA